MRVLIAACVAIILASTGVAEASAIRAGFDDNTLAANDDGSAANVSLGFTVNFFGLSFNTANINNNGNITFDSPLRAYTPFDLTSTGRQIIAPFFADVDTRGAGSAQVTYGAGTVDGFVAFAVNWVNVGYFSRSDDLLNSFQLVLIDRSDTGEGNFDFEFNYDQIQWETGDASGGSNGLGGNSARAGFSNGTGNPGTSFELAGSAINGAFLDGGLNSLIAGMLNSNVPGRYVFQVRNGSVIVTPPVNEIPLPGTALLLLTGIAGLGAAGRRRRAH